MTDREKVIKGLECIRDWSQFAVNKGWLVAGASEKMVKYAKDALELLKAQDVTPEELERLKKCRHDCKIECLLKEYDRVKNERDALLKAQETGVARYWTARPTEEQMREEAWPGA